MKNFREDNYEKIKGILYPEVETPKETIESNLLDFIDSLKDSQVSVTLVTTVYRGTHDAEIKKQYQYPKSANLSEIIELIDKPGDYLEVRKTGI